MNLNENVPRIRHMVSVIIPIYNGAATLGEQLEAFRAQTYEGEWEIVAVNNGSTDSSIRVVQDYQRLISQLRLVQALEKQSKGYASNIGARAARGDKLIFCDQDDVVAPGWLAALADALEKHDLACGTLELETLNRSSPWRPVFPHGAEAPMLGFLPHVSGCNIAVSRTAFEAVGGFSEEIPTSDDVDFTWRLQLHGYVIRDVPEAVLHYRYRTTYGGLWRQIVSYAEAQPLLYRRFAAYGMPRRSVRTACNDYKWVIRKLPHFIMGSSRRRARWIFRTAACWGRLRGSLHYRTLYL
jgi:GT2 family glycosyltransferase